METPPTQRALDFTHEFHPYNSLPQVRLELLYNLAMIDDGLRKLWNSSSVKIPLNKDTPTYTIEVERKLMRNSHICDLGGSTGVSTIYFITQGHTVTLVDISDYALEVARQKAIDVGFVSKLKIVQSDLSSGVLPMATDSFDVLFSRLSLHYFRSKRLSEIFGEILRILKPSGKAFITVKSPDDSKEIKFLKENSREVEEGVFDDGGILKSRFSKGQYEEILRNAGVKNYTIGDYIEKYEGKNDVVKSGNLEMKLIEIQINK